MLRLVGAFFAVAVVFNDADAQDIKREHYWISHPDYGWLTVLENQVVFTTARTKRTAWLPQKTDGEDGLQRFLHPSGTNAYMTANKNGEVNLSDKPEEGSKWGIIDFPKDEDDDSTSWLNSSSGGRVDVIKTEQTIRDADGKEHAVYRLVVGPPPKEHYDKQYPMFKISYAGLHPVGAPKVSSPEQKH